MIPTSKLIDHFSCENFYLLYVPIISIIYSFAKYDTARLEKRTLSNRETHVSRHSGGPTMELP